MKTRMIRVAVAAALTSTALSFVAPTPATAAPTAARVAVVSQSTTTTGTVGVATAGVATTGGAAQTAPGAASEVDPTITRRKIFEAVKRAVGPRWNAAVAAVRAGRAAFQRWFNGLPRPVQIAIRAVTVVDDIFWLYELIREFI